MRATAVTVLVLPLLLTDCGAKQDLVIGEIAPIASDAGTPAIGATSGTGAEPGLGGSLYAGTGAVGGSSSGSSEGGTSEIPVTAGAAGDDSNGGGCIKGDKPPLDSLIHRYSFDGTGTAVIDSIAGADGTLLGGATLDGTGILELEGDPTREHVNLPNRLVSSLTDLTVIVWMTWVYGAGYERVFDFGISNKGEIQGDSGTSYLAVMPTTGFDNGLSPGLGAEVKAAGHPTLKLASKEDVLDRYVQVAFVFRSGVAAELYLDGDLIVTASTAITLADIDDRNNWLGQSQWTKDHNFNGSYDEVRLYNVALTTCQLHTLLLFGAADPYGPP